jgi:hypothetical protein
VQIRNNKNAGLEVLTAVDVKNFFFFFFFRVDIMSSGTSASSFRICGPYIRLD